MKYFTHAICFEGVESRVATGKKHIEIFYTLGKIFHACPRVDDGDLYSGFDLIVGHFTLRERVGRVGRVGRFSWFPSSSLGTAGFWHGPNSLKQIVMVLSVPRDLATGWRKI